MMMPLKSTIDRINLIMAPHVVLSSFCYYTTAFSAFTAFTSAKAESELGRRCF